MFVKLTEKTNNPGSIQRVHDSFAENFLIPQGLAVKATLKDEVAWLVEANAATLAPEHDEKWALAVKDVVNGKVLLVTGRKDREGNFIPVNPMLIVDALALQFGIRLPQSMIHIDESRMMKWRRGFSLALHDNVEATMTYTVIPE